MYEDRILFLKGFVKELIDNSKQEIEGEKIIPEIQDLQAIKEEIKVSTSDLPLFKRMTIEIEEPTQRQTVQTQRQTIKKQEFGKITQMIEDPRITSIECSGPDKLITIKIFNNPSPTKISLTQDEISSIIEKFSQYAKIPVISGLFKATIKNLIITAVISDFVGSRFVITKINPAFIIGQNPPVSR